MMAPMLSFGDAVIAIRSDEQAGALLRRVEEWLHAPTPPGSVDVGELLAPYRGVTVEELQSGAR